MAGLLVASSPAVVVRRRAPRSSVSAITARRSYEPPRGISGRAIGLRVLSPRGLGPSALAKGWGRRPGSGRPASVKAVAALADFSVAAAGLFNNMRTSAALVSGGLVPIGFAAAPQASPNDTPFMRRLKQLHMMAAIVSLCCELIAIIDATIAINKLTETAIKPARSVVDLLARDFQLEWLGTNIHFLLGMLGFVVLAGLRAWLLFGPRLGVVGIFASLAVLSFSFSVINKGISVGDGSGSAFAGNFPGLMLRYVSLYMTAALQGKHVMQLAAIAFGTIASVYFFVKASQPETD